MMARRRIRRPRLTPSMKGYHIGLAVLKIEGDAIDVSVGAIAESLLRADDFRFVPESGRGAEQCACPFGARKRHARITNDEPNDCSSVVYS